MKFEHLPSDWQKHVNLSQKGINTEETDESPVKLSRLCILTHPKQLWIISLFLFFGNLKTPVLFYRNTRTKPREAEEASMHPFRRLTSRTKIGI